VHLHMLDAHCCEFVPDRMHFSGGPSVAIDARDSLERREGVPGLRLLLDSGPPNYGVSAAMMIAGHQWFQLNLHDGSIQSGDVVGHTRRAAALLPAATARDLLLSNLGHGWFQGGKPGQRVTKHVGQADNNCHYQI